MLKHLRPFAFVLVALMAACGGGGGSSEPPAAAVVRVEIVQSAALLTQAGGSKQLDAAAYDAQGRVIDTPIAWRSNTPAQISVDAAGKITAQVASGSSQITAEAGGVASAPLLAVAAALPPGAVALNDAQIIGDPEATDPTATPSFANTYRVVLTGMAAPAVGQLLINTESKPVGGRVVAVQSEGGQSTVTLQLVSLREMLPALSIRQTLDLSRAPLTVDAQVAAAYDVQRSGDTWRFTPRLGAPGAARKAAHGRSQAVPQAANPGVGPFASCESTLTGLNALPIRLNQPPVFSLTQSLALDLAITAGGLERLVARGSVGVAYDGTLEVAVAFEGNISCEQEVATIRLPVGGVFSLAVGGLVPIKVGFEAGGKLTLASAKLGLKAEASTEAQLGIACPGGQNCEFVRSLAGTADAKFEFELPAVTGNVRFEPEVAAFGKLELAIGSPFLRAIRFNAFEASMGPKVAGSFAPHAEQIANAQYKSSYGVTFESSAGLGSNLEGALEMLGVDRIDALALSGSAELARTPQGTVTSDRLTFAAREQVNFRVTLDPATLDFYPLIGPYNVREVVLIRTPRGSTVAREVGRLTAAARQSQFDFAHTAEEAGSAAEFTAFVVTKLLPLDVFALEVGRATAYELGLRMPATIASQGSASATVTLTHTDEQGNAVAMADHYVALSSDCGSVSPARGRTDPQGNLVTQVTPAGCAASIAVSAVASAAEGTATLAHRTVTATVAPVAPAPELFTLGLYVGRTPGHIDVWVFRSDDSQGFIASVPIGDAPALAAVVDAALAGTSWLRTGLSVNLSEPANLALNLAMPVGTVVVTGPTASAACSSNISISVGEVRLEGYGATGTVSVGGCLGRVALTTGDVARQVAVNTPNTEVSVTTGKVAGNVAVSAFGATTSGMTANIRTQGHNHLSVQNLRDSTVNVQGRIERQPGQIGSNLYVGGNSNLRLGPIAGADLTMLQIEATTFAAPPSIAVGNLVFQDGATAPPSGSLRIVGSTGVSLGSFSVGSIAGDLEIRDNRGFDNAAATAFTQERSVGGTTRISGNSRP